MTNLLPASVQSVQITLPLLESAAASLKSHLQEHEWFDDVGIVSEQDESGAITHALLSVYTKRPNLINEPVEWEGIPVQILQPGGFVAAMKKKVPMVAIPSSAPDARIARLEEALRTCMDGRMNPHMRRMLKEVLDGKPRTISDAAEMLTRRMRNRKWIVGIVPRQVMDKFCLMVYYKFSPKLDLSVLPTHFEGYDVLHQEMQR